MRKSFTAARSGIEAGNIAQFTAPSGQYTLVPYIGATGENAASNNSQTFQFSPWGSGFYKYTEYQVCASLTSWVDNFDVYIFVDGGFYLNVVNSTPFLVPSGWPFTMIPYDSVLLDGGKFTRNGTSFTAREGGMYRIYASLGSATRDYEMDLFVNGNRERAFAISSAGTAQGCRIVALQAGDRFEIGVYQGSGSIMSVNSGGYPKYWNWLQVTRSY